MWQKERTVREEPKRGRGTVRTPSRAVLVAAPVSAGVGAVEVGVAEDDDAEHHRVQGAAEQARLLHDIGGHLGALAVAGEDELRLAGTTRLPLLQLAAQPVAALHDGGVVGGRGASGRRRSCWLGHPRRDSSWGPTRWR